MTNSSPVWRLCSALILQTKLLLRTLSCKLVGGHVSSFLLVTHPGLEGRDKRGNETNYLFKEAPSSVSKWLQRFARPIPAISIPGPHTPGGGPWVQGPVFLESAPSVPVSASFRGTVISERFWVFLPHRGHHRVFKPPRGFKVDIL